MKLIRWGQTGAYLGVRPNHAAMRCRVCNKTMRKDQIYVSIDAVNMHRVCVKRFLEWSFGHMPMTPEEIVEVDPKGRLNELEFERAVREFEEYVDSIST